MKTEPRVLVGFEESGTLRDLLIDRGFDCVSVDILPGRGKHIDHHIQTDFTSFMKSVSPESFTHAILHPPCTRLSLVSRQWLVNPPRGKSVTQIYREMLEAVDLFNFCLSLPIRHIAVENPPMHAEARKLILRGYNQLIRVVDFGHNDSKKLGLWLKNLPHLKSTRSSPFLGRPSGSVSRAGESRIQKRIRSQSFLGVAEAMRDQWFNFQEM